MGVIGSPEKWSPPYWDEHAKYGHDLLWASDALLLGRGTHEVFAEAWPTRPSDEYVDRINSLPKYVASKTLRETKWNATVIEGDIAGEVAKLKQQPGQNILKFGTGELDRTLMQHNFVDEFHFWLFPVAAGSGQASLRRDRFHAPETPGHDDVQLRHRRPHLRPHIGVRASGSRASTDRPPSTGMVAPVMKLASSESR
jgi:dihydrofolate reductase